MASSHFLESQLFTFFLKFIPVIWLSLQKGERPLNKKTMTDKQWQSLKKCGPLYQNAYFNEETTKLDKLIGWFYWRVASSFNFYICFSLWAGCHWYPRMLSILMFHASHRNLWNKRKFYCILLPAIAIYNLINNFDFLWVPVTFILVWLQYISCAFQLLTNSLFLVRFYCSWNYIIWKRLAKILTLTH